MIIYHFIIENLEKRKNLRNDKKKEEEEERFQNSTNSASKVWIKAGTYDAGSRKEDTKDKGKLH